LTFKDNFSYVKALRDKFTSTSENAASEKCRRYYGASLCLSFAYAITECGPMPNVMVALPNIGGALCSTPQFG